MKVARPYADALLTAAGAPAEAARVAGELDSAVELLAREPDLKSFFEHPGVTAEAKRQVVREAFAPRVSRLTLNFLQLLIDKRRFGALDEIAAAFRARVGELLGEAEARVQTSRALDAGELQALAAALARRTGKKVRLVADVRPELLGGVRVVMGDKVLDGSIRGQLDRLRGTLLGVHHGVHQGG